MPETRANTRIPGKVTTSHSPEEARHIPSAESDGLSQRIAEVLGDRKVSWFARECGFGESLLRKYLAGAQPNTSNLVAIARAGGVTVDWLATGQLPRTRSEIKAACEQSHAALDSPSQDVFKLAIEVIQEWQIAQGRFLPADKFVRAAELLTELSEGDSSQVRLLSAKVLRLAA